MLKVFGDFSQTIFNRQRLTQIKEQISCFYSTISDCLLKRMETTQGNPDSPLKKLCRCIERLKSPEFFRFLFFICVSVYILFFMLILGILLRNNGYFGDLQVNEDNLLLDLNVLGDYPSDDDDHVKSNQIDIARKKEFNPVVEEDELAEVSNPYKHITDTSNYVGFGSHDFRFPMLIDMPKLVDMKLRGEEVKVQPLTNIDFPWVIDHADSCTKDIQVVVLIKSFWKNINNRKKIRKTWGDKTCWRKPTLIFFLMGTLEPKLTIFGKRRVMQFRDNRAFILKESSMYNDILLGDYSDHFYNNTLKFMTGVHWVNSFSQHAQYTIFADDDYFVHPYQVTRYLDSVSPSVYQRFVGGYVWRYSFPYRRQKDRRTKWDVTFHEYPWPSYPPYIASGFMLMSAPVLQQINVAMRYTHYFRFDDIFLGIVLHKLLIVPMHVDTVYSHKALLPNSSQTLELMTVMASHGYRRPQDLEYLWKRLELKFLCASTISVTGEPSWLEKHGGSIHGNY